MPLVPGRKTEPLDVPSALLPRDPPARAARWTAWLLLALGISVALFASLVPLPVTVVAPFVLVPDDGVDPLRAPVGGELAVIHVRPGQRVRAGDELFQIRSDDLRNAQSLFRQVIEEERALQARIRKLDEALQTELAIQDAGIAQAERELLFREKHLATARDLLVRAGKLADEGLLSRVEILQHELQVAESEKDLVLTQRLREQFLLQREERTGARSRARIEEIAETEKLGARAGALRGQLTDVTADLRSVRAPHDAVILGIPQRTVGTVVTVGMELCDLARPDSPAVAQLALPESGLPRLHPGQPVQLFLVAFPYQRHGTVPARLEWISPAPMHSPVHTGFTALARLPETPPVPVQVGMNGEARILVDRRTLVNRALAPLRALREHAFPAVP